MIEHRRRDQLDGIEQCATHLQKADLQRHRQPVHRTAPTPHLRELGGLQGEKLLDFQRRQRVWKSLNPEITMLPSRHGYPRRAAYRISHGLAYICDLQLTGEYIVSREINGLLIVTFCTQMTRIP